MARSGFAACRARALLQNVSLCPNYRRSCHPSARGEMVKCGEGVSALSCWKMKYRGCIFHFPRPEGRKGFTTFHHLQVAAKLNPRSPVRPRSSPPSHGLRFFASAASMSEPVSRRMNNATTRSTLDCLGLWQVLLPQAGLNVSCR